MITRYAGSYRRAILAAVLLLLGAACATTGATLGSGVGDRELHRPPWYSGSRVLAGVGEIGHLPIAYQRGSAPVALFHPSDAPGTPMAALLEEMNEYLDELGVTRRLASTSAPAGTTPPDVIFGCETDPSGDCADRGDGALGRGPGHFMKLTVGRPSASWVTWLGNTLDSAGAAHALVITLEVSDYWTRQQGLRGDKIVDLGTGHSVRLPWLTSLETPVAVLQLTGALVDRNGKAVRIGAEGLFAKRTPLLASSFGAQALLRDEDVEWARTLRREDLPGNPVNWQVALRHMVADLTGETAIAGR